MLADDLYGSTRETALPYNDGMRSPIILLPLLFILADGAACKDDEPALAEFGDPCGQDDAAEDLPCGDGLECSLGYCEDTCSRDEDCRSIPGVMHICDGEVCKIHCDKESVCPQNLAASPLQCVFEACSAI